MKVGLFFGSFNPIHVGHLIIANHILNEVPLNSLWFIVSPQNPLKKTGSLLKAYDRLHLVRTATENDKRIRVSDVEFHLPQPSYTIDTLTYLQEKYQDKRFSIIMGSDSFQNLHNWKNFETLIKNYEILIYRRRNFEVINSLKANIEVLDAPLLDISSTEIRKMIKNGKSIRYLVPENVLEEIESSHFYKS